MYIGKPNTDSYRETMRADLNKAFLTMLEQYGPFLGYDRIKDKCYELSEIKTNVGTDPDKIIATLSWEPVPEDKLRYFQKKNAIDITSYISDNHG